MGKPNTIPAVILVVPPVADGAAPPMAISEANAVSDPLAPVARSISVAVFVPLVDTPWTMTWIKDALPDEDAISSVHDPLVCALVLAVIVTSDEVSMI